MSYNVGLSTDHPTDKSDTNYKNFCYNYEINLELCRGDSRIAPTVALLFVNRMIFGNESPSSTSYQKDDLLNTEPQAIAIERKSK
jgi:hypothetical protein